MLRCWMIDEIVNPSLQAIEHTSFIGGKPLMPRGTNVPKCNLCEAKQTFFLQLSFPDGHSWSGLTIAIFSCTSCADANRLIPKMLNTTLLGADIPEGFLEQYQENFHFLVFETVSGIINQSYAEKIKYKPLHLRAVADSLADGNKIGGVPKWILEDESPRSYANRYEMFFLLQLKEDMKFDILDSASPQMMIGLQGNPELSSDRYYQLFIGNKIFMFGVCDPLNPLVYALTQI
jgi:hypothetical protein